jgi:hypothetical protein
MRAAHFPYAAPDNDVHPAAPRGVSLSHVEMGRG